VLGFTNMLVKLLSETDCDHIAVIFDAGRTNFRNDLYKEYKAHRPDPPSELIPQFSLIRAATQAFNVASVEMPGFEADDLIATYAHQAVAQGADVTIVSSDKDLMQLVGERVRMLDPIKNRPIGVGEVKEKFGVSPELVVDVQALIGDSTDNVPGVRGIGVKTAAELIAQYGNLDGLLAHLDDIKQTKRREILKEQREMALLSRELVRLRRDVPVEVPLATFRRKAWERETVRIFLQENGFRSLLTRLTAIEPPKIEKQEHPALPAASQKAPRYECAQNEAALVAWLACVAEQGAMAICTETESNSAHQAKLVGISMALPDGRACYVPLGHGGGDLLDGQVVPEQIAVERALELLAPVLADQAILKIGHNIKQDMLALARHRLRIAPIDDTMLMSHCLEGGVHGHDREEISELFLGHKTIGQDEVVGTGRNRLPFSRVPLEKASAYAAEKADVTMRLHQLLKPRLMSQSALALYETTARPLVAVLADMERVGIKLDISELNRLSAEFGERMQALEAEAYELAGRSFNIASPKQLGEILFDELKLGQGMKGKTGAYATGADVLEELAHQHPLPRKVLDYRQLAKLKSTYSDTLVGQIDGNHRVHTSYAMAATPTGRLSSYDPNLQNIPIRTEEGRRIRHAFIAEKGHVLMSADYSQIELRLAAEMAGIDALKEAFRQDEDIHALTASQVFGMPVTGMDPMVRRRAKAINFGIIYGISPFGLAQQLGIPQAEAKSYIEAYFLRYPGIREYMERIKKFAREHGYVETLFGRRCHVPGIGDKNPARRAFMERAAINAPLQGTAADIIKRAMIRLPGALAARGLKAQMLLQVHDELVFEVPRDEVEETAALVKDVMERAALPVHALSVPLVVGTGFGVNWAEAH
jgi:DNA polymerase-1